MSSLNSASNGTFGLEPLPDLPDPLAQRCGIGAVVADDDMADEIVGEAEHDRIDRLADRAEAGVGDHADDGDRDRRRRR